MKKHIILFAILLALVLTGCGKAAPVEFTGGYYSRNHDNSRDHFSIFLSEDGTYAYWESFDWSDCARGQWTLNGDILCLRENLLQGQYFRVEGDSLYYLAGRSKGFTTVELPDNARFIPDCALNYGTYYCDNGGFGGEFTVTIREDGTFTYYEGMLSSYIGMGEWSLEGDNILCLKENLDTEHPRVQYFQTSLNGLKYLADRSTGFIYVHPEDGTQFTWKP